MSEKPLDQRNLPEGDEPKIVVNEYGETRDSAVVVEERDRTVLLTEDESIVIDKQPRIDVVPTNRPRKVYSGMWGQPELLTVGLAMLAVLTVILVYLFVVIPANQELEDNIAERRRLEAELASQRQKYGGIDDTQTHVASLMASVDNFEANFLPIASSGKTALYQRLNGLIAANGLVNTSGPAYSALEMVAAGEGVETDEERGRSKYRSLFPGVYVTMTLEGPYRNLRRFIRDIETGNDFVIVSSVELEPSDSQARPVQDTVEPQQPVQQMPNPAVGFQRGFQSQQPVPYGGAPAQQPSRNKGRMHGEVVSLRLEMAAYFRRANVIPQEQGVQ